MGFSSGLIPDDEYTQPIKKHSLEKIRLHNYYAEVFSTAMKKRWPQRAYLGLYSGPGRAIVSKTGEIVETTPIAALRLPFPFTKYIFVDNDEKCIRALRQRIAAIPGNPDVSLIHGDVHDALPEINRKMPKWSRDNGLVSFCFVDPFSADLKFEIIKNLSQYRMDFLILIMIGRDIRTNFQKYYNDESDSRIAKLIDDPEWRSEWRSLVPSQQKVHSFILKKFNEAMTRLGYLEQGPEESHPIKVDRKGVLLYSLVFYSKHRRGKQFWKTTVRESKPQLGLGFDS